jgi:AcrR family transcriptional regulator
MDSEIVTCQEPCSIRWGSGSRAEPSAARLRLLQSAIFCFQHLGVSGTSMDDIAAQAKVTRQTIYRYFHGRHEIIGVLARRELEALWTDIQEQLKDSTAFCDFLLESLIYLIKKSSDADQRRFLFCDEVFPTVRQLFLIDNDFLIYMAEFLRAAYVRLAPPIEQKHNIFFFMVAEWFNRQAISYITTPNPIYQTDDELRYLFKSMMPKILEE